MNAIENNVFTNALISLGQALIKPKAILCISAHWQSLGTKLTHMTAPRTIHDFYGFSKELCDLQYPAQGAPDIAELICQHIKDPRIQLDDKEWGLDHGAWSILRHLYPKANIPTLQLSIDYSKTESDHFEIGQQLNFLRKQGVLIIGSGNIVHNLSKIKWGTEAKPYPWAIEFDEWVKNQLISRDIQALTTDYKQSLAGQLSVPTPDHYSPLLYVLGASNDNDKLNFIVEGFQNSAISMRSIMFDCN